MDASGKLFLTDTFILAAAYYLKVTRYSPGTNRFLTDFISQHCDHTYYIYNGEKEVRLWQIKCPCDHSVKRG
jgi:hypothetical protein